MICPNCKEPTEHSNYCPKCNKDKTLNLYHPPTEKTIFIGSDRDAELAHSTEETIVVDISEDQNAKEESKNHPENKRVKLETGAAKPKKSMPLWFKLVIFLTCLALIGVTGGILLTESWVDVVDHQLDALRKKDIPKAYTGYTSHEFQTSMSLNQFTHFLDAHPAFYNNQSSHFGERLLEHNKRILRGKLLSNDHKSTPVEYKLVKENGKWKIQSIDIAD